LDVLKGLLDNSVDSAVTDPPYGLSKEPDIKEVLTKWLDGEEYDHGHKGFMGKSWDSFVPHPDIWKEVYRVLKPGGHALVFAGTRTQDLMTVSLRLAGFEVRDVIEWLYATGFPKSHDVSKAFDKRAGAERKVISEHEVVDIRNGHGREYGSALFAGEDTGKMMYKVTAPATDLARKWDGWGTALKPAHEPIIVVRKPLHDGKKLTVADCVEKYGTGAINIDASRIAFSGEKDKAAVTEHGDFSPSVLGERTTYGFKDYAELHKRSSGNEAGRFPANCITLDSDEFYSKYFNITPQELSKKASKKDRNSDWQGEEIALEGRPPKHVFGDGLNSATKVRKIGDEEAVKDGKLPKGRTLRTNHHPTVKPTDLMAWLIRLITPPNGIVLDPFAGSGSTLVAAKREGFDYIGIEMTPEYVEIAKARTGEAV